MIEPCFPVGLFLFYTFPKHQQNKWVKFVITQWICHCDPFFFFLLLFTFWLKLSHNFRLHSELKIQFTSLHLYFESISFVHMLVNLFRWFCVLAIYFCDDVTWSQTSSESKQNAHDSYKGVCIGFWNPEVKQLTDTESNQNVLFWVFQCENIYSLFSSHQGPVSWKSHQNLIILWKDWPTTMSAITV